MASDLIQPRLSSLMQPIPPSKPSSETSLCDESLSGELIGGTTAIAQDTPLSTTATTSPLLRRSSRTSPFRPSRLRTRTEDTVPAKNTSYRNLLSSRSSSSVLPMVSSQSHNSFRAIVGNPNAAPYTMTEDNPFESSKDTLSHSSDISSLSNDSAHRFQKTGEIVDDKRPPPNDIFVKIRPETETPCYEDEQDSWQCRWVDGSKEEAEDDVDAPFDEVREEKKTISKLSSRPPPPPPVSTLSLNGATPVQTRPKAPKHLHPDNSSSVSGPLSLQRNNSAPDISNRAALPRINALPSSRTITAPHNSPSLHRVGTDTTVTTTTANTTNSGRPAIVQRSTTLPTKAPPLVGDRPRRKDQKLPTAETVFSFGSRVGQSSMLTPTSATTTTGPMSDLSPRIMIPKSQLSRRKLNGVQQDINFLWKKVASPVRRWAGADDKVDLQRSKTGCLA